MKLTKDQILGWLGHPVTQEMLNIVKDFRNANKEELDSQIINGPSISHLDLHLLSQLKGQILAFDEILNIKETLFENSEDREGEEHELSSTGAENTPESE